MAAGWFLNRRLKKQAAQFWRLMEEENPGPALAFYEQALAPHAAELAPELRAAYHLERWLGAGDDRDQQALGELAATFRNSAQVVKAHALCRWLAGIKAMAQALLDRRTAPSPLPHPCASDPQVAGLLGLSSALMASFPGQAQAAAETQARLQAVAQAPAGLQRLWSHLTAWSLAALGRYQELARRRDVLDGLPPEQAGYLRGAVYFLLVRDLLARDDAARALQASQALAGYLSPARLARAKAVLAKGVLCPAPNSAALAWLAAQAGERPLAGAGPEQTGLQLAWGAALLAAGRYKDGRQELGRLDGLEAGQDPEAKLRGSSLELMAMAVLAETRDWREPEAEDDPGQAAATLAHNRSRWSQSWTELSLLLELLAGLGQARARQGDLLRGLAAYADRDLPMDHASLGRFASATQKVASDQARQALSEIEGELTVRLQAATEAHALVAKGDMERLADLHRGVLAPMGQALPAALRAAVALSLWMHDPAFDPLPELTRLAAGNPDDRLLQESLAQVRVGQGLRRLAKLCRAARPSAQELPPLQPLRESHPLVGELASLAASLVLFRQGELDAARRSLPGQPVAGLERGQLKLRLGILAAQEDYQACQAMIQDQNPGLGLPPRAQRGLLTAALLKAVEQGERERAGQLLASLSQVLPQGRDPQAVLFLLALWLIQRQSFSQAKALLDLAAIQGEDMFSPWSRGLLEVVLAASQGWFSVVQERGEHFLAQAEAPPAGLISPDGARLLAGWVRLFRLEAELALAAKGEDEASARWRALLRSVRQALDQEEGSVFLAPYLALLAGLLDSLGRDTLVSQETISRLNLAREQLRWSRSNDFVDQALDRLRWRQRVIADFWSGLAESDFRQSRAIYMEELAPNFGDKMPHAIQLGSILLDWDAGGQNTVDLLKRLANLEREAPELDPELIKRVKDYIVDGDQLREITRLLKERDYQGLLEHLGRVRWVGLPQGQMPVAVAIAQLLALYKTKHSQDAMGLGKNIVEADKLAPWVTDLAALLLGYVYCEQGDFQAAAEAFAKTQAQQVVGHDMDRYWAAANFSLGIRLLQATDDRRAEAFDAFSQAVTARGGQFDASRLAPLFIHFAFKNLQARNGDRAQQAFFLLGQSLSNSPPGPQTALHLLLSQYGQLLCRALRDEDISDLGGERFLELEAETEGVEEASQRGKLLRMLRASCLCQELRWETRRRPDQRRAPADLAQWLLDKGEQLAQAQASLRMAEPRLDMLMALVRLLMVPGADHERALEELGQALRAGVQSPRLSQLLRKYRENLETGRQKLRNFFDFFDVFLADHNLSQELRSALAGNGDLVEAYRAHSSFLPRELLAPGDQGALLAYVRHLEQFKKFLSDKEMPANGKLRDLAKRLEDGLARLKTLEKDLQQTEREALEEVSALMRKQTL